MRSKFSKLSKLESNTRPNTTTIWKSTTFLGKRPPRINRLYHTNLDVRLLEVADEHGDVIVEPNLRTRVNQHSTSKRSAASQY